jgi:hypothetical protein
MSRIKGTACALATLLAMGATALPRVARADKGADVARAEALFEEGRKLMAARDYAGACPKLAESQRLDPAAGTLLNLAVCYERAGKNATAWATYKDAELSARRAAQPERAAAAAQKAGELEAKLSRIAIDVPADARVAGLEVRCDGQPVREPTWGLALPYDAGSHDVEAVAPGHRRWAAHVELSGDARSLRVKVPALEELPAPPPEETAAGSRAAEDPHAGSGQRAAGLLVGGIGVLGIGAGAFAGLRAKSRYDDALAACSGGTVCADDRGPTLRDQASTFATVSTVAFAAGGVAVATGALLFFTAPRPSSPSVALAPSPAGTGLSLAGRF